MHTRALLFSSLVPLAALAACAGRDPPDPIPPVDEEPAAPRVRILVNDRPQDAVPIEVELDDTRYGDPLHVVIDQLAPGQRVTVASWGGPGNSEARFEADADGTVDLARDAPLDGDWIGIDADGFITMMQDAPAVPVGEGPDMSLTVRVLDDDGKELARDVVVRGYVNAGIVAEPVADGTRRGVLALPPGDGPFFPVLAFGGSEGGTGSGEFLAYYLATLGYAALGVGYFGAEGLPATLDNVPLEILEDDLAFLTADPRVADGGVIVMGSSRGGELALLLGATFPSVVRGVVANVPSGYVWPGLSGGAGWTVDGAPVAAVPPGDAEPVQETRPGEDFVYLTLRGLFLDAIADADAAALDAATIRAEDIPGPVLFLSGDDDQLWPSCVLADVAVQRRVLAGVDDNDVVLCLPEAGHFAVTVPGWSAAGSVEFFMTSSFAWWVMGGTEQGNGRAWRAADTAMRTFLESTFAD